MIDFDSKRKYSSLRDGFVTSYLGYGPEKYLEFLQPCANVLNIFVRR